MCGIYGEINFDGNSVATETLEIMGHVLAPRGPDASGVFLMDNVGFGHRRLKIVDLSEKSNQPIVDKELGLILTFNGMIYNYRELRKELKKMGYRFFSSGDSEVVLKSYHAWGERCVEHLDGMFAFAICETGSRKIFCARDKLGIKPFYYTEINNRLRFASTLPALLAAGGVDTSIDPVALHYYMMLHAVVPAPRTILSGIKKIPPATTLTIDPNGKKHFRTYWKMDFNSGTKNNSSAVDWQNAVEASLKNAVKKRLLSDVPVGILLSGGVDSSLIVALAKKLGAENLQTFSLGFESIDGERGDEFQYSDMIVEKFKTKHHKIFIKSADLLRNLPDCIAAMSEPMVSHDNIGFFLLSSEVSKHVKVVQSGQGADEIFGGYKWYPPLQKSNNIFKDYCRLFCDRDQAEFREAVEPKFVSENFTHDFITSFFEQSGGNDPVNKALSIDAQVMLPEDPVKRVDNMTMRWGIEARVPFLDQDLVELAARIPTRLKVGQGGKYILKEVARKFIPSEVVDRPKGYFPVPALKHIEGKLLEIIKTVVTDESFYRRGIFSKKYVEKLLREPKKHITPLGGSKLWQIALLELWLKTNEI